MPQKRKIQEQANGPDSPLSSRVRQASAIFEKHSDLIRTVIYSSINDKSRAEDIFQDFFLSLVRKPIPPGIRNVQAYLRRAVRNDILDGVRQANSYRARVYNYAKLRRPTACSPGPENSTILNERNHRIIQLIETQLPNHQARAVIEKYGNAHNIADAAARMGVKSRTFSRYLCMALKKIRQCARHCCLEFEDNF